MKLLLGDRSSCAACAGLVSFGDYQVADSALGADWIGSLTWGGSRRKKSSAGNVPMHPVASRIAIVGFFLFALGVGCPAQAEELLRDMPKVKVDSQEDPMEQLPPPQELRSEPLVVDESSLFQAPTRLNRYDIWQFYAVGHQGRFRPRVIYSPHGSFYLHDGQPYPWVSLHALDFMPHAVAP
jgi:hypothetical protein